MTDVYDRKPLQILRVRPGRDHIVVVRDKLGVNPRFLAGRHDVLQPGVLFQSQGDGDLVQLV